MEKQITQITTNTLTFSIAITVAVNGKGVPEWPAFSDANPEVMYLGPTPHIGTVPSTESLKVLYEYFRWRLTAEGKDWAK